MAKTNILQGLTKAQAITLSAITATCSMELDNVRLNSVHALEKMKLVETDRESNTVSATPAGVDMEDYIYNHVSPRVRELAALSADF